MKVFSVWIALSWGAVFIVSINIDGLFPMPTYDVQWWKVWVFGLIACMFAAHAYRARGGSR